MATSKLGEMPLEFPDVEQYFKRLRFHLVANDKADVAKAVLLSTCGQKAFSLIEILLAPSDVISDDVTYDSIKDVIIHHLRPKRILHFERHQLHSMTQVSSESVTTYVQRLRNQANKCEFGELRDGLLLSQFIFGLSSQTVRSKLLAVSDLNFDRAIQEALLQETITSASISTESSIAFVNDKKNTIPSPPSLPSYSKSASYYSGCHSCGNKFHRRADCKFRSSTCTKCNRKGHIASVCRSSATYSKVNDVEDEHTSNFCVSSTNQSIVLTLDSSKVSKGLLHKQCSVGKTHVSFLIDTGSEVSILPYSIAVATGLKIVPAPEHKLHAFGGGLVEVHGKIENALIKVDNQEHSGRILVTGDHTKPILGLDFLKELNIFDFNNCFPLKLSSTGFEASFRLKRDANFDGMKFPARSLPFSMQSMVETELKRLLSAGIIYPIENPVVSAPIVPVVKQAGAARPIRICGDYSRTLNRFIDRDSYKLPRLEEILQKIAGATVYSVLDLEDAYLQVSLTEESQPLTCISTHIGHFAYKKLQFGISAAPLIFQEAMDKVLKDVPYVAAYQDDIIIGAPTQKKHDEILQLVKSRLSSHNFTINVRKSHENRREVRFLGYLLRNGQLLPHPDRLSDFSQLQRPTNKDQLRSLLGTLRHYGCFCPNFSAIARPLYALLKTGSHWKWTDIHNNVMDTLTSAITKGSITCYDLNKPLFVASDASKSGIGFVLSHDKEQKQIVWVGSRVLSQAEENYSNIEREALAIVEATKYFHRFIAGRHFTILSDHAPLKYIFGQSSTSERVSCRLQRWAITLRAYDYNIEYISGSSMFMADTLSRLPHPSNPTKVPIVNLLEINSLDEFANGSSLLKDIAQSTDHDLARLKVYITKEWPRYIPKEMLAYSKTRSEYSIQSGIIYRGVRIVPPRSLRSRILGILHSNHPGIIRMTRLARQYFWWPNIDASINSFIQRCSTCQINARKRTNASLSSWPDVTQFGERVHIDVAQYKSQNYLVYVDSYTKWIDIQVIKDLSTNSAIEALRQIFKYVGLPQNLVSDNGTNFTSEEFDKFLSENFISHTRTPPGHHSSNGQAERVIEEFKFALKRAETDHVSNIKLVVVGFCLQHNTIPACNGSVPNDFIFRQSTRTRLSAQFTERDHPTTSKPSYVRVENKLPAPSNILTKIGTNTYLDGRSRLVHEADITPKLESDPPTTNFGHVSSENNVVPEFDDPAPDESEPQEAALRRSVRVKTAPKRYGYNSD